MNNKQIIALDADGVLLDYHVAYRNVWQKTFGYLPALIDPNAYFSLHMWDVPFLDASGQELLRRHQDAAFWSTMPAIAGAVDAATKLHAAGYELVCVTAVPQEYAYARLANLKALGYPIESVVAANTTADPGRSVKADALVDLQPVVFVDDFAPYLRGVPENIHRALVMREPNGSPNIGEDLKLAHSTHADLAAFAEWWLDRQSARDPHVV